MIPYIRIFCSNGCPTITVPDKYSGLSKCWTCGRPVSTGAIEPLVEVAAPPKATRQLKRAEAMAKVPKGPDGRALY